MDKILADKEADIEAQIAALTIELSKVKMARTAIARYEPYPENDSFITSRKPQHKYKPSDTPTIMNMVEEILADYPDGLTALDILDQIKIRYATDIARTSLSPQLSRLKHGSKLHRVGKSWILSAINKPSDESEGL